MKLEDMRKIAEARTPGEWKWNSCDENFGPITASGAYGYEASVNISESDAAFIAMAANNINKLLAVAEAAKHLFHPNGDINRIQLINMSNTLEELERE